MVPLAGVWWFHKNQSGLPTIIPGRPLSQALTRGLQALREGSNFLLAFLTYEQLPWLVPRQYTAFLVEWHHRAH